MAYRFKHPDRSLQKEIRRIARREAALAVAAIDARGPRDETVHALRKHCKKLRGLIRLVRPGFDHYAHENAALRAAADSLGILRDAAVLVTAYDAIAARHRGGMRPFAGIRSELVARQRQAIGDRRRVAHRLTEVRAGMVAAAERMEHWRIDGDGFDALAGGLTKTYKRARKAMRAAAGSGDDNAFHDWRKRVKYHGYHARLIEPAWPDGLKAHRAAAERLNDLLGEHHDLAVFAELLRREPEPFGAARERAAFTAMLRERQRNLAGAALALGRRLLAERPEAQTRRWRAYWTIWHNDLQQRPATPAA